MLQSTRGIVIHTLKYSETSIIVKIYTELYGIQSYLVRGIRKSKSKVRPGLFQPMTLLDLVVNHREQASLQSAREIRVAIPYRTIPFDIRKSSVILFINELLYKIIREEEPNADLFAYLWKCCTDLDAYGRNISDFHTRFAIGLMHYLGIFPRLNYTPETPVFNMRDGIFQHAIPGYPEYLAGEQSRIWVKWLEREGEYLTPGLDGHQDLTPGLGGHQDLTPGPSPKGEGGRSTRIEREWVLETVLLYFQLHLPGFRGTESQGVLREVFGDG